MGEGQYLVPTGHIYGKAILAMAPVSNVRGFSSYNKPMNKHITLSMF